jgi:site-specific DNA-methyltransferase (adenine-specific)
MKPHYQDDRVTLYHGDCIEVMRTLPDSSVDAVVTDPPYGLEFMGKDWDAPWKAEARTESATVVQADAVGGFQDGNGGNPFSRSRIRTDTRRHGGDMLTANQGFEEWSYDWATQALRILKPGGHLLAFGGTRTWHRLAVAIEDAGFEIRDSIAWMYGSGFPKSLDVSKAIDKAAGAERTERNDPRWIERYPNGNGGNHNRGKDGIYGAAESVLGRPLTTSDPATPAAEQWQGWGTALKPAFEPIVVARKPLIGTVAANVLTHGTGALNIDGCRIGTDGGTTKGNPPKGVSNGIYGNGLNGACDVVPLNAGRWPANVILDESQAAALDAQSGVSSSKVGVHPDTGRSGGIMGAKVVRGKAGQLMGHNDSGGASRFFYTAKANSSERPNVDGVAHPTVKPLDLMRYLVRLVTPPGGTVLEPFAGSGTTAEACIIEGFKCIAIEMTDEYLPLILDRITKPIETVMF